MRSLNFPGLGTAAAAPFVDTKIQSVAVQKWFPKLADQVKQAVSKFQPEFKWLSSETN